MNTLIQFEFLIRVSSKSEKIRILKDRKENHVMKIMLEFEMDRNSSLIYTTEVQYISRRANYSEMKMLIEL